MPSEKLLTDMLGAGVITILAVAVVLLFVMLVIIQKNNLKITEKEAANDAARNEQNSKLISVLNEAMQADRENTKILTAIADRIASGDRATQALGLDIRSLDEAFAIEIGGVREHFTAQTTLIKTEVATQIKESLTGLLSEIIKVREDIANYVDSGNQRNQETFDRLTRIEQRVKDDLKEFVRNVNPPAPAILASPTGPAIPAQELVALKPEELPSRDAEKPPEPTQ